MVAEKPVTYGKKEKSDVYSRLKQFDITRQAWNRLLKQNSGLLAVVRNVVWDAWSETKIVFLLYLFLRFLYKPSPAAYAASRPEAEASAAAEARVPPFMGGKYAGRAYSEDAGT